MTRRRFSGKLQPAIAATPGALFALHVRGRLFSSPLEVVSVEGEEAVNELYSFDVRATVDARDDVTADRSLLLAPAELALLPGSASARHVHGVVASLGAEAGTLHGRHLLRLVLRPRMWVLTRRQHCRVFEDQSVIEIVTTLLREHQVIHRLRLVGQYPKRQHTVQYRETDFELVERLLSEAGIFYFFDHPRAQGDAIETNLGNSEVLVLCDTPQYYPPIEGTRELSFRPGLGASGALEGDDAFVSELVLRHEPATTQRLERAYDFQRPGVDLSHHRRDAADRETLFVYDFGGDGDESPPEHEVAAVRLEQDRSGAAVAEGVSGCRRLLPGRVVTVTHHPIPSLDRDYVITRLRHAAYAPEAAAALGAAQLYENRFTALPSGVAARPPAPPRRIRQVTETAVVVGPPGAETHVDAHDRIKVQFHWDLQGQRDGRSSCWVRVAQSLAGTGWGAQFIPRVGMEVVVTFLGGDLDRPLVTGAVYNALHPLPFPLPQEVAKSGVRTSSTPGGSGFHEVSFDDATGRELLYVHAQRDAERIVRHDDREAVGNDQQSMIGGNRQARVRRADETVAGESIRSAIGETSTGAQMQEKSYSVTTGDATFALSGGDAALSASGNINLRAGGDVDIDAAGKVRIAAAVVAVEASMVLVTGDASVIIKSGGPVVVKGGTVTVNGDIITEN
jgi:type VI secretion system secreted protein VgrG